MQAAMQKTQVAKAKIAFVARGLGDYLRQIILAQSKRKPAMTMIHTTPPAAVSAAQIVTRIADAIMVPLRAVRAWQAEAETVNELSRLSTRELNDLGLIRGDLQPVAKAMTRRKAL
jgi:uncharacterized protein YjiS (DUF1127 family)